MMANATMGVDLIMLLLFDCYLLIVVAKYKYNIWCWGCELQFMSRVWSI